MFGLFKERRRAKQRAAPFPTQWLELVKKNFSFFNHLPAADQQELLGHIKIFTAEKNFEGCGGLVMTDEIRLTIAAQACVLLLHRPSDYYPKLQSILVYPNSYVAEREEMSGPGVIHEFEEELAGESWQTGAVVLAWDEVLHSASDPCDGYNVVFHEFAHQLDEEDGSSDGAPVLEHRSRYLPWARILGKEYRRLRRQVSAGEDALLDGYGASNPAEFFAVATEFFFEQPHQLKKKHPALYDQLRQLYRQDPAAFVPIKES